MSTCLPYTDKLDDTMLVLIMQLPDDGYYRLPKHAAAQN